MYDLLAPGLTLQITVSGIENKIPDIVNLANKAALNTKAKQTENTIPDTSHFISRKKKKIKKWKTSDNWFKLFPW